MEDLLDGLCLIFILLIESLRVLVVSSSKGNIKDEADGAGLPMPVEEQTDELLFLGEEGGVDEKAILSIFPGKGLPGEGGIHR